MRLEEKEEHDQDGTATTSDSDSLKSVTTSSSITATNNHTERIAIERGWRSIKVDGGPLDVNLVGVLRSLASTLADAGIAIFVVSTFDTDYVLVKESSLAKAVRVLKLAGHVVRFTS